VPGLAGILDDLNPVQLEAVTAPDGPLLILAGAGSGKTRVLTRRIAFLVAERETDPRRIVGVTFTNKAAGEMRSRLGELVGPAAADLRISTFHAFGARVLREHGPAVGVPRAFTILDDDDGTALVRDALKEMGRTGDAPPGQVLNAISLAKAAGLTPARYREKAGGILEELVAGAFAAYEEAKKRAGALDFDDLLLLPLRLLSETTAGNAVRSSVDHVLVDEYQDTNTAQYRLLRELARDSRNITCVGDPDQSIYRWRGADIGNILRFEEDYPEARIVTLEQNYRSTGNILAAASALIANNQERRPKKLWTDGPAGEPIRLYTAVDETDEARFVAAEVCDRTRSGAAPGDFAVLYRTHAQSRALEEAFVRTGVPYAVFGGPRFYARREVKDLTAYLRVAVNRADTIALARALGAPTRGIGDATVDKIAKAVESSEAPLAALLSDPLLLVTLPSRAREPLKAFANLLERMGGLMPGGAEGPGFAAALELAIEASGYVKWLQARGGADVRDRVENIHELLGACRAAEEAGTGAGAFLETAALMADVDRMGGERSVVALMTMHNAKGLEFERVFLCGLEDGLLPHASSLGDPAELEEERRLMYVGLTRARVAATLTMARGRRTYERFQWTSASRFLSEIPAALVESAGGLAPPPTLAGATVPDRADRGDADPMPDYDTNPDEPRFKPGDKVFHERFGAGRVVSAERGPGGARLVVSFSRFGRKTLDTGMARLSRMT